MVEFKFSLFQVQVKRVHGYAIKLGQATLCIAPERLNAVDMSLPISKLIFAMAHPEVLVKPDIDQAVIASPAVRVNYRAGLHVPADNALQRSPGAVGHDLGIDLAVPLQQPEHNRLAVGAATTLATDPMRTEVRFIDFYRTLQRRLQFTGLGDAGSYLQVNTVHRSHRKSGQFGCIHRREIQGKTPYNMPEFSFADFRTAVILFLITILGSYHTLIGALLPKTLNI